jgi:hypothetical protein
MNQKPAIYEGNLLGPLIILFLMWNETESLVPLYEAHRTMERLVERELTEETSIRRKLAPVTLCPPQTPHGLNPGRRLEKSVTICLSFGTAFKLWRNL